MGNHSKAIDDFSDAIRNDEHLTEGYYYRGLSKSYAGFIKKLLKTFRGLRLRRKLGISLRALMVMSSGMQVSLTAWADASTLSRITTMLSSVSKMQFLWKKITKLSTCTELNVITIKITMNFLLKICWKVFLLVLKTQCYYTCSVYHTMRLKITKNA